MIYTQWLSAVLLLVGVISTAVLIVANYKKVNREVFEASSRQWQEAIKALREHNDALKDRLDDAESVRLDMEQEAGKRQGVILQLEKEKSQLMQRNLGLYDRLQDCRSQLARLGVSTPDPGENGEAR